MPYKDKKVASLKRREYELNYPLLPIIKNIKRRILKENKNIVFNLSKDWAKRVYTGKCELTNLPFRRAVNRITNPFSPSVDRIKPENGYVPENCRVILMGVNSLKGTGTDDDVYTIAKALLANRKRKT